MKFYLTTVKSAKCKILYSTNSWQKWNNRNSYTFLVRGKIVVAILKNNLVEFCDIKLVTDLYSATSYLATSRNSSTAISNTKEDTYYRIICIQELESTWASMIRGINKQLVLTIHMNKIYIQQHQWISNNVIYK